jgi:hypothetical protein
MVIFGAVVLGCVKENRVVCPCRLLLDLSQLDTSVVSEARINIVGPSGYMYDGALDAGSFMDEILVEVPKGACRLCVYSGEEGLAAPGRGLHIPYGDECPPVYMQSAFLDTDCEQLIRTVSLNKNHCRLSVCIVDSEHFPFSLAVRGWVAGYGADGAPMDGDFFCSVDSVTDVDWTMSVPRQVDDSMILEVSVGSTVLKTFALGEYIRASGYDWNAADLKDITIGIDYTRTKLTVSVRGWDEVYEFDVVI